MPRTEFPVKKGTLNAFPKEKGKNFAEITASLVKFVPGPGEYKTVPKWGCAEKKQSVTKKNTYIEQIFRHEGNKPSPA